MPKMSGYEVCKKLRADPATAELLDRVVRRELDPASAAGELLERHLDE